MPIYRVEVEVTSTAAVLVEAATEKEARAIAEKTEPSLDFMMTAVDEDYDWLDGYVSVTAIFAEESETEVLLSLKEEIDQ